MEYKYLAVNKEGKVEKGYEYAESKLELLKLLKKRNLVCVKYSPFHRIYFNKSINNVTYKDISMFCKYMTIALDAKMSFIEGLDLIISRVNNRSIKKSLDVIKNDMENGESLHRAMIKHATIYPDNLISMIKLGEDSGNLKEIFRNMEKYYLQQYKLKKKFLMLFIYPIFVLIVALSLQIIFMISILPKFINQFKFDLNTLPNITKIYLGISKAISLRGIKILVIICVLTVIFSMINSKGYLKIRIAKLKMRIPLLNKIVLKKNKQEFISSMSMLLNSGINLVKCYEITINTISNSYIKQRLYNSLNLLLNGETLSNSLKQVCIFEKFFIEVVAIGEEGGKLNESFETLKDILTEDMETLLIKITEITQPITVILVGIIITTMIIAMLLPMLNMIEFMAV